MKPNLAISFSVWVLLAYVFLRVATFYPRWTNNYTEATLSWDVFGYYLYLPSTFIYKDLKHLGFIDEVFEKYHPAGDFHHAVKQDNGAYVMKYPVGMSIMYLPWFGAAHVYASLTDYPADGFSLPYQFAISFGSIIMAILGLAILRRVLLRYYSDAVVAIVLAIIGLGTNYLNYVSFDGAMTHNYLFTLYALLFYLTIEWHQKPRTWLALCIGLTIGWATIIRPVELMAVLIPILWGIYDKNSLMQKVNKSLRFHVKHLMLAGIGLVVVGMIQLIYWKWSSGSWLYYSYGDQGFDWLKPNLINGLFSYRKGWLIYTPVMIIALLGFIPFFKTYKPIFWAILIYFVIDVYVVYSWQIWWYGGSFGSRPLIQAYTALAFPMGAAVTYLLNTNYLKYVAFAFMFLCIDLNLVQTWQAHNPKGGWHPEFMTRKYYWKIFGSTNAKKGDKKFLDVKYELKSTDGMRKRELYFNDFENDTTSFTTTSYQKSGQKALLLDGAHQEGPKYSISLGDLGAKPRSWIRVSSSFMYTIMEWNEWQQGQLITELVRADGKKYRGATVRLQRLTDPWIWHDLQYEVRLSSRSKETDSLRVYLWNAGGQQQIFVDDTKVELWEEP